MDRDVAGLAVDLDLDRRGVELVERGGAAERMVGLGFLAHLADADDLAAEPAEPAPTTSRIGRPVADAYLAALDGDRVLADAFEVGGHRRTFALMSRQARRTALPINTVERLADVCWS